MKNPFRCFNSSPEVIRLAVMMYIRFPLSLRQVEDLLSERGIDICHETVSLWMNGFVQAIRPFIRINISISLSSRSFSARNCLLARVSRLWMVFAAAQRFRPCSVTGPADLPPWNMHTRFPLLAAFWHCILLRFDKAWQRGARIRPPIKVM